MRIFTTIILFSLCFLYCRPVDAQGCIAIRGSSSCGLGSNLGSGATLSPGNFMVGTGLRYFKSFRHFRGSEEESHRIEEGTQVINHSYFLDLNVNYGITDRLYGNVVLPFVHHTRSSMYEHGGNPPNGLGERHETSARGLADIRLGIGYWLFDPKKHKPFNYAVAVGVKLPTGNYDYKDTFYNQGENRDEDVESVVDQSIQPGDGGTGISLDVQGYHAISHALMLSTNLFYMVNPKETNGVLTRNGRSVFSCPDQYAARLGLFYNVGMTGFNTYLGGRLEGIPAEDLIGGSAGYRRPGYAVSVEPGAGFERNRLSVNFSVPVALVRNRTQSYEDKQRTLDTGVYRHGDAAFADYLLNINVNYRFAQ